MSLIGALNIGKSALAVTQAAIQTTGNNIANAGNADYTRQVTNVSPNRDQQIQQGIFVGTGVNLTGIQRQIDEALEGRIRGSVSDDEAAGTLQQWLGRVESVFNELSDQDLSTQLSTFFNSWSNLANKPQDIGLRQVVIQNGASLAQSMQDLSTQLTSLQGDVDHRLQQTAADADMYASQIAELNGKIVQAEGGGMGTANGLRDQRDAALKQLSTLMNIKTVPHENGMIDVYVNSEPLVLGDDSRGVGTRTQPVDGSIQTDVIIKQTNGAVKVGAGQIGALGDVRGAIDTVLGQVNKLASNVIFELNKIHASGQGLEGLSTATASSLVNSSTAALNSAEAGLKFAPGSGSFVVHVTNKTTGLSTSTLVQVDLDGANGNDTTLTSLQASLDAIDGVSANLSGGRLSLAAESGNVEFSFSQDSSGTLAALGINGFFTGSDASNIAVSDAINSRPSLLAAAKNGEKGDNQTALAIAGLEGASVAALDGATLKQTYESMINGIATTAAAAKVNAEATATIRSTLTAQREALSGVSLDEEAVNMIKQQRAFQGAAKLIGTINEMMDTLLQIV
jgi:flagellar hook-associated protein 1 FlgK